MFESSGRGCPTFAAFGLRLRLLLGILLYGSARQLPHFCCIVALFSIIPEETALQQLMLG